MPTEDKRDLFMPPDQAAYEIIKADPSLPNKLELDGKEYKFRGNGMMRIEDEGKARAIAQKYGYGKSRPAVTLTRVKYPRPSDRGHNYFFGSMPPMPWHKYDENGNRIDDANSID